MPRTLPNGRRVLDESDGYCIMCLRDTVTEWVNRRTAQAVTDGLNLPDGSTDWFDAPELAIVMTYHVDEGGDGHAIQIDVRHEHPEDLDWKSIRSMHTYLDHDVDMDSHGPHLMHEGGDALLLLAEVLNGPAPFPDNWFTDGRVQIYLRHLNNMVTGARQLYNREI